MPDFHVEAEPFQYTSLFGVEKDGYAAGAFRTAEHYGTHVDAPCHFFSGLSSIDQIPARDLVVPCAVIDVRSEVKSDPDYQLTVEKIRSFEQGGVILEHSAVLLLTGWADRWPKPHAYRNADDKGVMHFPGFGAAAAEYLVKRNVACLGIDTLSADRGISETFSTHKSVLGRGLYIIENMDNLDMLPARGALLVVAPLRIEKGTGSPARVFALKP